MSNSKYILDGFEKEKQRRLLQKTKKQKIAKNGGNASRSASRIALESMDEEAWEEAATFERIMPLTENDRKKAVLASARNAGVEASTDSSPWPGRVMELSPGGCRVLLDGEMLDCVFRGALARQETGERTLATVGDRVAVTLDGFGGGVIESIAPRQGEIARLDTHSRVARHVIVANTDQLVIIASWRNPDIWLEMIDRALVSAWRNDIQPLICVNKIDLADSLMLVEESIAPYCELDIPILLTSSVSGAGIDDLREALTGRTSALTGLSGAGKSTLLSTAFPGFTLKQGAVNDETRQGRHTTTQAVMLPIGGDGFVIDTPGIREFGIVGLSARELEAFFPEIGRETPGCYFRDCRHRDEPGCAVREALSGGRLALSRYKSFIAISDELGG